MRFISPSLSTKIAASIDIAATLLIEHIGSVYRLPFYHPAIVGAVFGLTYVLFKWKDEIAHSVIHYSFFVLNGSKQILGITSRTFGTTLGKTKYNLSNTLIKFTTQYRDDINSRIIRMRVLKNKGPKYFSK